MEVIEDIYELPIKGDLRAQKIRSLLDRNKFASPSDYWKSSDPPLLYCDAIWRVLKEAYFCSGQAYGVKHPDFVQRISGNTLAITATCIYAALRLWETGFHDRKLDMRSLRCQSEQIQQQVIQPLYQAFTNSNLTDQFNIFKSYFDSRRVMYQETCIQKTTVPLIEVLRSFEKVVINPTIILIEDESEALAAEDAIISEMEKKLDPVLTTSMISEASTEEQTVTVSSQ